MYLQKNGYKNYTILEREGEVGGKCHSPYWKGKRYETGAIMGCKYYYTVHEIEELCGFTHDGPQLSRKYKRLDGTNYDPYDPKKNITKIPKLLKMKNQMKTMAQLLETKYKGYDVNGHRGVSEGRYDGFECTAASPAVSGENPNLKDLALPFADFCKKNGVELTQDVWIGPFTSFGYGYFDEIPAAYVLKYLDFKTLMDFVNIDLWTWKDGTQSIWEHLNDYLDHPALLNEDITKVERKDDKVYVTHNGQTEEFDKLIITSPLQYFPDYADATEEEKELFAKIDYERYDVLGCTIKPGQYPDISYYLFDNMDVKRLGHLMVYYDRWHNEEDQIITTYVLRNHKGRELYTYEEAKAMVLEDMKTCGSEVDTIEFEKSWYYFPHVFSEDYANGWYEKVEALQGKNNTYYAGEVMSFGDMEETATYSKELIRRFF